MIRMATGYRQVLPSFVQIPATTVRTKHRTPATANNGKVRTNPVSSVSTLSKISPRAMPAKVMS